jgi:hypothetical protein
MGALAKTGGHEGAAPEVKYFSPKPGVGIELDAALMTEIHSGCRQIGAGVG